MIFSNGARTLMQYFALFLKGSKSFSKYTLKAVHILVILDTSILVVSGVEGNCKDKNCDDYSTVSQRTARKATRDPKQQAL